MWQVLHNLAQCQIVRCTPDPVSECKNMRVCVCEIAAHCEARAASPGEAPSPKLMSQWRQCMATGEGPRRWGK